MSSVIDKAVTTLQNAPLPLLVEKLGLAIAEAQLALDQNSIKLANQLAQTELSMPDGRTYNLLSVGFKPTFYSFTEASIEVSMEFSLAESESFSIGGGLSFGQGNSQSSGSVNASAGQLSGESKKESKMFGASVSGYYASKFESSAKGSSSLMARMISLPAPDRYQEILENLAGAGQELPFSVKAIGDIEFDISDADEIKQTFVIATGGLKPYTYSLGINVDNRVILTDSLIDFKGLNSVGTYSIEVKITDAESSEETITFNVEVK